MIYIQIILVIIAIIFISKRFQKRDKRRVQLNRASFLKYDSVLRTVHSYYNGLNFSEKRRFVERIIVFMREKKFESKEGINITPEMKILISSSAIQLTFGLEEYYFNHFHTILVYPQSFHVPGMNQALKGGTTPNGYVAFSWRDFEMGYQIHNDGYNLGLHEMAHALKIDVTKSAEFDQRFAFYYDKWESIGLKEFKKIKRANEPSFLRDYAGENLHEFFAVCVEHFFEKPAEFQRHLPDIYNHLCVLLNQNPIHKFSGTLEDDFAEKTNRNKSLIRVPKIVKKRN